MIPFLSSRDEILYKKEKNVFSVFSFQNSYTNSNRLFLPEERKGVAFMITYLSGDATKPETKGNNFIIHICNDLGGWGQGFVMAISSRWPEPENAYTLWHKSGEYFQLGEIQSIPVDTGLFVINMIAQKGVTPAKDGTPPIRYDALEKCLEKVALAAKKIKASVHMPRIGCGLAGGSWEEVEPIIKRTLEENNIPVYVYDFNP